MSPVEPRVICLPAKEAGGALGRAKLSSECRFPQISGEEVGLDGQNACVATLVEVNFQETGLTEEAVDFLRLKLGMKCAVRH